MELSDFEKSILAGDRGGLLARMFSDQVQVGEFFGAERFVEVGNAHFMGDSEVFGGKGLQILKALCDANLKVQVPTTRNANCVDLEQAGLLGQPASLAASESEVKSCLAQLGVMVTNTCIGYQTVYQPVFGEHVAWGDTGTVAYANSVIGARTNYESGTAALAAGLTGRTPAYGYHLDHMRRANVRVRVECELHDYAHWGALGAIIGEQARGYWSVPVIELSGRRPTQDQLKHLGAALASYGSMAMYHVAGITPEAATAEAAVNGRDVKQELLISARDIEERIYDQRFEGTVDLVVFTAPQLSLMELRELASSLQGRQVADGTHLIVTTNATSLAAAEEEGYAAVIRQAGGMIFKGTCWYTMDPASQRQRFGWKRLVTNSAKLVNIIQAHGFEPALRSTEECIEAAVTGRLM